MTQLLMFIGIVMLACILMQRLTDRLPIPSLLVFLFLELMESSEFHLIIIRFQKQSVRCA